MSERLYDYDPAEALDSAEAIEVFMADVLETGDAAYVAKAEEVAKQAMQCISDSGPRLRTFIGENRPVRLYPLLQ
jgi:DNA-binding phage protein